MGSIPELNLWWLNHLILLASHFQKYQGEVVEQTAGLVGVGEVEDEQQVVLLVVDQEEVVVEAMMQ